jgi:hypothetical protein
VKCIFRLEELISEYEASRSFRTMREISLKKNAKVIGPQHFSQPLPISSVSLNEMYGPELYPFDLNITESDADSLQNLGINSLQKTKFDLMHGEMNLPWILWILHSEA